MNTTPHTSLARKRNLPAAKPHRPRSGWLWAAVAGLLVLLGGGLMLRGSASSWQPAAGSRAHSLAGNVTAASRTENAGERLLCTQRIDAIQLGVRLRDRNPIREQAELVEPEPATWRKLSLYMTKESGLGLWIDLLRPLAWIDERGATVGGSIYFEMPEMGAVGDANVMDIGPCPVIEPGDGGAAVIGRFKRQAEANSGVVHLELKDQIEPTGVTDNHPYWSVDRQEFIPVGQLRVGELVDTVFGLKHVASITPIDHDGFLYNLETTEHVYRVASLGTLVHNSCAIIQSKMYTLDLSNSAWRQARWSQEGLMYVLRDAKTGELLKVGQTTSKTFIGRFEKYVTAAQRNARELTIDAFEVPLTQRGAIEGEVRRSLGSIFALPWDNTGRRLGFSGSGVP